MNAACGLASTQKIVSRTGLVEKRGEPAAAREGAAGSHFKLPSGHVLMQHGLKSSTTESLILAQNERWRRGLGMQVERESA